MRTYFLRTPWRMLSLPSGLWVCRATLRRLLQDQDPIFLKQEVLGRGGFSTVTRVWDVSTGFEYASKTFHSLKKSDWKKEAAFMQQILHDHMVRLHFVTESPAPQLLLDFLPLGSLREQQQNIFEDDVICTLQQTLLALTYLHEQSPPIVHRDIKPENILIQSLLPFRIKLADFDLSKASNDLQTLCGSEPYLAPELAKYWGLNYRQCPVYTKAADIWSLGVVVLEYLHELPQSRWIDGMSWCEAIVERLNDCASDDRVDLLRDMLARTRLSAEGCLNRALQLDFSTPPSTPRPSQPYASSTRATEDLITNEVTVIPHGSAIVDTVDQKPQASLKPHRARGSFKRQRSPVDHYCTNRHDSWALLDLTSMFRTKTRCGKKAAHESLIGFFKDMQLEAHNHGSYNARVRASMDALWLHLQRLNISQLKSYNDEVTECTIIMAATQSREFTLANFTSSDLAKPAGDLADQLTRYIEVMSPTSGYSSQSSRAVESNQYIEDPVNRSPSVKTLAYATATTTIYPEAEEGRDPKPGTISPHQKPVNSVSSWSTASNSMYPVTMPSGLLDDINLSGCAPAIYPMTPS